MNSKILRVAAGVICTAMLLGCEKKSDYEICVENVYPSRLKGLERDKYNTYKDYSQREKEIAAKSQASTACARAMNTKIN